MTTELTYGSCFTGIGAADLAFDRAGLVCKWQIEIDPYCTLVLNRHWPDVPRFRDIRTVGMHNLTPVDVIVGGFPCQGASLAGKRLGLADDRTALFFEITRIVSQMRKETDGRYPQCVLLENVPGLFSTNKGQDFGVVLDTLAEVGALDIAWRVLDAQYFGVAQRRKRVFFVGDFTGERAAEILLKPESGSGDPPARGQARQDVAATLGGGAGYRGWSPDVDRMTFVPTVDPVVALSATGIGVGGPDDNQAQGGHLLPAVRYKRRGGYGWSESVDLSPTLEAESGSHQGGPERVPLVHATPQIYSSSGDGYWREGPGTLRAKVGASHEDNLVAAPVAYTVHGEHSSAMTSPNPETAVAFPTEVARSLDTTGGFATNQGGTVVAFTTKDGGQDASIDISPTLRSMNYDQSWINGGGQVGVAYSVAGASDPVHAEDLAQPVTARKGDPGIVAYAPVCVTGDRTHALRAEGGDASEDGTGRGTPIVTAFGGNRCSGPIEVAPALTARGAIGRLDFATETFLVNEPVPLLEVNKRQGIKAELRDGLGIGEPGDPMFTLQASAQHGVATPLAVRRLLPVECERLQGLPDDHTAWGVDASGKRVAISDAQRYRQCGNAMAQPVMHWIARRLVIVLKESE